MKHPGAKLGFQLVLLSIAFGAVSTLRAQVKYTPAVIDVCNKGTIDINVVVATRLQPLPLKYVLHVDGWTLLHPGICSRVYRETAMGNLGKTDPVYFGFAFYDSHGKLTAGTVGPVPDFGRIITARILTQSDKKLCVSENKMLYNINDLAEPDCAVFHPEGNVGPFSSFTAALYFQPVSASCVGFTPCQGGGYILDVAPRTNDANIHASVGTLSDEEGSTNNSADGGNAMTDLLRGAVKEWQEQERTKKEAEGAVAEQMAKREEEDNRKRWAGSHQSPASYDPRWMGLNMVVTGTVSRVEVDPTKFPNWVTIYFKESPDATFVVCSPYPDMFQERVGTDLSALVGKTLEAAGLVEGPFCGHKVPKGSIRVLESSQWKLY